MHNGIDYTGLATLITALGAFIVTVGTFLRSGRNRDKLNEIHTQINGRTTELVEASKQVAYTKGVQDGKNDKTEPENQGQTDMQKPTTVTEADKESFSFVGKTKG